MSPAAGTADAAMHRQDDPLGDAQAGDVIAVTAEVKYGEPTYSARTDDCEFRLIVFDPRLAASVNAGNAGGADLWRSCDLSTGAHARALGAVLDAAMKGSLRERPFQWMKSHIAVRRGRPAMAIGVAAAALASARWDAKHGRLVGAPASPDPMLDFMDPARVAPELDAVFRARGVCLRPSALEQVDVRKVAELPDARELLDRGAGPSDRVPWGGLIWYAVAPCPPSAPHE